MAVAGAGAVVGNLIKVSHAAISDIENGKTNITFDLIITILSKLESKKDKRMEATKTNLTISNGTKIWDGTIKIAETTFPHYAEHIVKSVNEYDKLKASHQELLEAAIAVISIADRKTKEFDRLKQATSNAKELG